MKDAGHPLPEYRTPRQRRMDEFELALRAKGKKSREMEHLRVELDKLVEKGIIVKTPSGNYSLPDPK